MLTDFKSKYFSFAEKLNYFAFMLFMFCLPLSDSITIIAGIIWMISCLSLGNFKESFKELRHKYLFFAFVAYLILTSIWYFPSKDKTDALFHIESKLSLMIYPLLFTISGKNLKMNRNKLLLAFLAGNIVASLYCYVHTFVTNLIFENGHWQLRLSFLKEQENLPFRDLVNMRISTFSYEFLSELKQSSYFAMYIIFSLCIAFYLYKTHPDKKLKHKVLLMAYFVYFAFFIYLLQSRAGLISIVMIVTIILVNEIIQYKRTTLFLAVVLIGFLGIVVITSSPKIRFGLNQVNRLMHHPAKSEIEGENDRFQMWYSALPILKENFVFGVGPSNEVGS